MAKELKISNEGLDLLINCLEYKKYFYLDILNSIEGFNFGSALNLKKECCSRIKDIELMQILLKLNNIYYRKK